MKIVKHTSLEETKDVKDTLQWKLTTIEEDGRPTEEALADYIAFALDNIQNKRGYLKDVVKQIQAEGKRLDAQAKAIKEGAAEFLIENGIEKLNGGFVSSVTVTPAKDEKITIEEVEEYVVTASENEVRDLLLSMDMAEVRKTTREKITKASPATIRINKRKIQVPEVEK
jgi:hypothetical protein